MPDAALESPLALGIDLGTSAIKLLAIDAAGHVVGEARGGFATFSELPHQAEQNPGDWLAALSAAMRDLSSSLEARLGGSWRQRIGAIGLTGQLPTLVCLGEAEPSAPAITWRDGRADRLASLRVDATRRAQMYARTGMPIDGRYLAPMFRCHFEQRQRDVRCLLSAKDYLFFALTGVRATDPSTAAGYGLYDLIDRRFSVELAAFWDIAIEQLPSILPPDFAAALTEAGARALQLPAGIPVIIGAADSACASYAMSGLDPRSASISLGSSAVVILATEVVRFDPRMRFLLTPHVQAGWYGQEMDLLATGAGYQWLTELFGWAEGELDRRAAGSPAGAQGLFFAPYLAGGEQGALWNPDLRAGLFGLSLHHSHGDIARAYLEGVCFELRRCVEVLAELHPVDHVMVSGSITHSPSSMQMLADILKRPIGRATQQSPAAYGAALLAQCAVEHRSVVARTPRGSMELQDPSGQALRYDGLYDEYCRVAARCA